MRLRDLGISSGRLPAGMHNAITDVAGVRVGHVTLLEGDGALREGIGPVRTGVTAVVPQGDSLFRHKVTAAVHTVNGFGKTIGFEQIRTRGTIETPIVLTNTLNVGLAADALIAYMLRDHPEIGVTTGTVNPVVGECNDGFLNDIRGRHVRESHIWQAIDTASAGAVAEGSVGAGTGTACFQFKGGIGTASRVAVDERFTVGALVQTNFGAREEMTMYGVPIGRHLAGELLPQPGPGSIMIVLATDAPLDSRQLARLAKRAPLALGRTGTTSHDGSGDFVIAFSTAKRRAHTPAEPTEQVEIFTEDARWMDMLFLAAVEAIEEAIWNSMIAAATMTGRDGNTLHALPHDSVIHWFRYYRQLE